MAQQVIDPVCEMHVDPLIAPYSATHEDCVYYFCSDRCFNTFKQNPRQYANPQYAGQAGEQTHGEELEEAGTR